MCIAIQYLNVIIIFYDYLWVAFSMDISAYIVSF